MPVTPHHEPTTTPVPYNGLGVPQCTLLLVEDSRYAAESIRLLCRRLGIRLRRAASVADAQAHLRVYRPNVALIDIGLPDGCGLDLIRAMVRLTGGPDRIVAISGEPGHADAALAAGADAFVAKPISVGRHLPALLGSDHMPAQALSPLLDAAQSATESAAGDTMPRATDRNAGADPLALHDDLRVAADLLNGPPCPMRTSYAGQFLASLARQTGRVALALRIEEDCKRMDRYALRAHIVTLTPPSKTMC